jgi:hypothetical protein
LASGLGLAQEIERSAPTSDVESAAAQAGVYGVALDKRMRQWSCHAGAERRQQ